MEPTVRHRPYSWPAAERMHPWCAPPAYPSAIAAVPPLWGSGVTPLRAVHDVGLPASPTNVSPMTPPVLASGGPGVLPGCPQPPSLPPLRCGYGRPSRVAVGEWRPPPAPRPGAPTVGTAGVSAALTLPPLGGRADGAFWSSLHPLSPVDSLPGSLPTTPMGAGGVRGRAPHPLSLPPLQPTLPPVVRPTGRASTPRPGPVGLRTHVVVADARAAPLDGSSDHERGRALPAPVPWRVDSALPCAVPPRRRPAAPTDAPRQRPTKKARKADKAVRRAPSPRQQTTAVKGKAVASAASAPASSGTASSKSLWQPPQEAAPASPNLPPLNPFSPQLVTAARDAEAVIHNCALTDAWRQFSGLPMRPPPPAAVSPAANTTPSDGGDRAFPPSDEADLMQLADSLATILASEKVTLLSTAARQLGAIRATYGAYCAAAALEELSQRAYRFVPPAEVTSRRRWITSRFAAARQRVLDKYAAYARVGRFFLGAAAAAAAAGATHAAATGAAPARSGRRSRPKGGVRRGGLDAHVAGQLKCWLLDHIEHPYASRTEKQALSAMTGLTVLQISNYLINARVRWWSDVYTLLTDTGEEADGDGSGEEETGGGKASGDDTTAAAAPSGSTTPLEEADGPRRARRSPSMTGPSSSPGPELFFVDEHNRLLRLFTGSFSLSPTSKVPLVGPAGDVSPLASYQLATARSA